MKLEFLKIYLFAESIYQYLHWFFYLLKSNGFPTVQHNTFLISDIITLYQQIYNRQGEDAGESTPIVEYNVCAEISIKQGKTAFLKDSKNTCDSVQSWLLFISPNTEDTKADRTWGGKGSWNHLNYIHIQWHKNYGDTVTQVLS